MTVNHKLSALDPEVQYIVYPRPTRDQEPPCRVVFVDTPGLNRPSLEDSMIAKQIANWLDTQ
jgi:hypothetical protein